MDFSVSESLESNAVKVAPIRSLRGLLRGKEDSACFQTLPLLFLLFHEGVSTLYCIGVS